MEKVESGFRMQEAGCRILEADGDASDASDASHGDASTAVWPDSDPGHCTEGINYAGAGIKVILIFQPAQTDCCSVFLRREIQLGSRLR